MQTTFYKKEGRRYVPVYEYDTELMDSFPGGSHVVICYPGGKSIRYNIDVNYAAMIAAGRLAEDVIAEALVKSGELRPQAKAISQKSRDLYDKFVDSLEDDERYYIERASAREMSEKAVQAMQKEAEKLMTNDAIKQAYEHFLFLCELSKENKNS
jgi:phosphoribosylformylglycinamidine (FGAM) synthase PurS component